MSDEDLGRAIMAETGCLPSVGDMRRAGAAARRLVHEDDLRGGGIDLSAISRLIIGAVIDKAKRRDKAILWDLRCAAAFAIKQLEPHLARLTAERDAALAREAEAFRAGAEAMRRKAAWLLEPKNDKSDWTPYAADCHRHAEAVRALPLPAHQSTTSA